MAAFANLTEAERERLEMLAEEAAEIVQAATKILRHGYESFHPSDQKQTPNRLLLVREIRQFEAIVDQMKFSGDIDPDGLREVWRRKLQYTHHQGLPRDS